jgi:hypothetical protein
LFEAAFALGVDVAFAAEEGEEDGEEDEGVGGCPEDEGDPDAEVVDFENLMVLVLTVRCRGDVLPCYG